MPGRRWRSATMCGRRCNQGRSAHRWRPRLWEDVRRCPRRPHDRGGRPDVVYTAHVAIRHVWPTHTLRPKRGAVEARRGAFCKFCVARKGQGAADFWRFWPLTKGGTARPFTHNLPHRKKTPRQVFGIFGPLEKDAAWGIGSIAGIVQKGYATSATAPRARGIVRIVQPYKGGADGHDATETTQDGQYGPREPTAGLLGGVLTRSPAGIYHEPVGDAGPAAYAGPRRPRCAGC